MNKYLFIIIILLYISNILAQEFIRGGEISFAIKNNVNNSLVEIEMVRESNLCWLAVQPCEDNIHDLTTLYDGGSYSTTSNNIILDFYACWGDYPPSVEEWTFGLGWYSFTAKVDGIFKDLFYIDYRTSDLCENFNLPGKPGDIGIDFDVSTGKFYYRDSQIPFPDETSIWEEKNWIKQIREELEPLSPENFQLTSSEGHPYLSWSPSANPEDWWTGYTIYRSVVPNGNNPGVFTKIETVCMNCTNYIDLDLAVNGPMTAYYKVAANNGTRESEFTEALGISVGLYKDGVNNNNFSNTLYQNYPNPFNPTTLIEFSLQKGEFVNVSLYNTTGIKVAELLNNYMIKGKHKIEFNGDNLPSGVYFYIMKAGNFVDTKKLILLK